MKKHRKSRIVLLSLIVLAALGAVGVSLYAADYYPADLAAQEALATTAAVSVQQTEDGLVFLPADPAAGFIFYPGGKVDHIAYAPLMRALAERGVLCVLTDMPLRLAVLDMNAADGIPEKYPAIPRWAIGGHSLGGAMAASYAAKHADDFDALALLAAYSTAELPEELAVVSVYGTMDTVMDREKYAQYRGNLPEGTIEVVLDGGNHAQFGSYGMQDGDTLARMLPQQQVQETVDALLGVILGP